MSNKEKAVVVFSGGQDSTTCLFWAVKRFSEVVAVTFDYKQRHSFEIQCAKNIANEIGVEHHILDMSLLNQLAPNALTRKNIEVEAREDDHLPSTFVPGRNLLFFSFAGILAAQIGAKHIVTGVSETDFSGYPDCRDTFIKSLNTTLNLSMDESFVIHTPLMELNKAETWQLADRLGAFDFVREKTLTCYNGIIADGCGECPACKLRKKGLQQYLQERKQWSMSPAEPQTESRKPLRYHHRRILVSKEFTFDAAHHLENYDGKCQYLHGHTYKAIFGLSGYCDERGLVIDFGNIKEIWKTEIEPYLDHKYLNNSLPAMNTTAENMAVWIYEKMSEALTREDRIRQYDRARVEFVRLYETPTSYAEARREWMEFE